MYECRKRVTVDYSDDDEDDEEDDEEGDDILRASQVPAADANAFWPPEIGTFVLFEWSPYGLGRVEEVLESKTRSGNRVRVRIYGNDRGDIKRGFVYPAWRTPALDAAVSLREHGDEVGEDIQEEVTWFHSYTKPPHDRREWKVMEAWVLWEDVFGCVRALEKGQLSAQDRKDIEKWEETEPQQTVPQLSPSVPITNREIRVAITFQGESKCYRNECEEHGRRQ